MAKKTNKQDTTCIPGHKGFCYCKAIMAIVILVLVWWKPAVLWAQVVITIAAEIVLFMGNFCCCKHKKLRS